MNPNDIAFALAVLTLAIGVPLNAYVTLKLRRLYASNPRIRVLREREITAAIVLVAVIVFGLIFLNNDLEMPFLGGAETKLITRLVILALAVVPAGRWLWLYRADD